MCLTLPNEKKFSTLNPKPSDRLKPMVSHSTTTPPSRSVKRQ
jgi:hypothetical protein